LQAHHLTHGDFWRHNAVVRREKRGAKGDAELAVEVVVTAN
jgi:hypothetical protein